MTMRMQKLTGVLLLAVCGLSLRVTAQTTLNGDQIVNGNLFVGTSGTSTSLLVTGSTTILGNAQVGTTDAPASLGVSGAVSGLSQLTAGDTALTYYLGNPPAVITAPWGNDGGMGGGGFDPVIAWLKTNDPSNPTDLKIRLYGAAIGASIQTGQHYLENGGVLALQDYGGSVGIGTSSPAYLLDVAGDAGVEGNLTVVSGLSVGGVVTIAPGGDIPMFTGTN